MPLFKKSMFMLCFLGIMGLSGAMYGYYSSGEPIEVTAKQQENADAKKALEITVYVTGEVNKPGLAILDNNSRVSDAINACGGLLATADEGAINMAQPLKDGMKILVPAKKTAENLKEGNGQSEQGSKVNINTADAKTLTNLPGIGPAMAKRIIEYRSTEGSFQSIEDIKKVRGIGEGKFNKMKDMLTI